LIVDKTGYDAAIAALSEDMISTRDCVAVTLADGTVKRFIIDTVPQTLDGNLYVEVPAGEIESLALGAGTLADSAKIHLDGAAFTTADGTPDELLIALMATPLRDRPIQISTMVLDVISNSPIGLIPIFVGFVDQTNLDRSNREEGSLWTLSAASYRAYSRRLPERVYTHNDHQQRWPADGLLRNLADTVFTNGVARWNTTKGSSSGVVTSGSTGGGVYNFNNGINLF